MVSHLTPSWKIADPLDINAYMVVLRETVKTQFLRMRQIKKNRFNASLVNDLWFPIFIRTNSNYVRLNFQIPSQN